MAGAGIRSFAKFHGQMPWIATTGITFWQTALKWTADCQVPQHTFVRETWQETQFKLPPFYIESPPGYGFASGKIRLQRQQDSEEFSRFQNPLLVS
jgi:hypothetical protein